MKKIIRNAFIASCLLASNMLSAQYIKTIAGTGYTTGYTGDGGPATNALMYSPTDIAFDMTGNLYITDFLNNVIRKLDTSGIIYTIAGTGFGAGAAGAGGYSGDGGPATNANLNGPFALAIDATGNIIFADGYNHVVRKINTSGIITTIAGKISAGYSGDGGPATDAELNNPVGLAIDKAGNIYIADDHNNVIRMVTPAGIINSVAGNGTAGFSGDGGPATAASMDLPIGIAFDTAENMYIADVRNNKIRRIDKVTRVITTVAGTDSAGYTGDGGPATAARIDSAERVNFDDSNHLYISDFFNNVVRKVDASTGIITTVAGNGYGAGTNGTVHDYCGEDSLATHACLYLPYGVAFDKQHRMYICDRGNDVIRRVGPLPVPPIDHSGVNITGSLSGETLRVYPTVSSGDINVEVITNNKYPAALYITNVLGEVVYSTPCLTNTTIYLHLSQLPKGAYILSAATGESKQFARFIIN